jgi:hypothetical protein
MIRKRRSGSAGAFCGPPAVHAIEGDWPMMVIEPVPGRGLVRPGKRCQAWLPHAGHGRKLYAFLRHAGFSAIDIQLVTRLDTEGRLLPMIRTIADYARGGGGGEISDAEIDRILFGIEQARAHGSYLFLAPQFILTAIR